MVTQAKQWKSKTHTPGEYKLGLPSGNEAMCRPVKPETFLETGMIPDPLTADINKAINSKRGLPPSKMAEMANDPKKLAAAVEMFDRVLVYCVVDPPVEMPPLCIQDVSADDASEPQPCGLLYTAGDGIHLNRSAPNWHKYSEAKRDEDILYADAVDLEDKQFIFQWAIGGTSDVNKFREELERGVDSVQSSQGVRKQTKRASGHRR